MLLSHALLDSCEILPSRSDKFLEHVPDEWLSAASALSSKATIRRQRLPSEQVMWLRAIVVDIDAPVGKYTCSFDHWFSVY